MEDLFTNFQNLGEKEVPSLVIIKARRRILILKSRPYIYGAALVLITSLIFVASHLLQYIIKSGALEVIRVMFNDFEFSLDYLSNSLLGLKEVLPLLESGLLLANIILVIGLLKVFQRYRHDLLKI